MALNARRHKVPAPGESTITRATIFDEFGNSIRDIVAVANGVDRAQLVADLTAEDETPSATNPLVVYRNDARGLHRIEWSIDGENFLPASGVLSFATTGDATSFVTSFGSMLTVGDRAMIGGVEYRFDGVQFVPVVMIAINAAQVDASAETQVCTVSVPVVAGRRYEVHANVNGQHVTGGGTPKSHIRTAATPGIGTSGAVAAMPVPGLVAIAINTPVAGSGEAMYTAAATGTVVFALTALSTAPAFRVPIGQGQIWVKPVF